MHAASRGCNTSSTVNLYEAARARYSAIVRTALTLFVATSATLCGCVRAQHYDLRGQVLALDRGRQEVTIKHEDVRGLMPGMTMPFKVSTPALLDGLEAGDLVEGSLTVKDSTGYLTSLKRIGHEAPPPVTTLPMNVLQPGEPVPDVHLVDETGTPRRMADWKGKVVVVTFIYTRCPFPDFCPKMDRQFKAVQTEIANDSQLRDRVALLSVSFDPAFDTPAILAARARQLGANPRIWHFATGDLDEIDRFASSFGVSVVREGAGADSVTHNLRTAVIGSDGTLRTVFSGNEWTPSELTEAVRLAH
jgi:protein SCO1